MSDTSVQQSVVLARGVWCSPQAWSGFHTYSKPSTPRHRETDGEDLDSASDTTLYSSVALG